MNTPWNKETHVALPKADAIFDASLALKDVKVACADFRGFNTGPSVLCYADPP